MRHCGSSVPMRSLSSCGEPAIDFEILRVEKRFLNGRIGEGLAHLAVDLGDYVGRNAGRPEQREPRHRREAGIAGLGDGRHVRQQRHALRRADGDEFDRGGFRLRHGIADADEHQLDVARDHVLHRRRRALVVHGDQIGAGDGLEHFHIEMAARAGAVGAVIQLAGLGLGECDQFLDVVRRHRRMQDQPMIDLRETGDRGEIGELVAQVGVKRRIDDEGGFRTDEQRVAVARLVHHIFRGNLVIGARLVLDHRLGAPVGVEVLRQDAREHIGHAPRRRRHDDGDRLRRISLRVGVRCRGETRRNRRHVKP